MGETTVTQPFRASTRRPDAGVVTGRALHVALPVLAHQQRGIGVVQLTSSPSTARRYSSASGSESTW
jgi:hypothetical protein